MSERREKRRLEVERRQAALDEARHVFDRQGPEAREVWRVRRAEQLLELAQRRLDDPEPLTAAERAAAEEERQRLRAPPDLQALVMAHAVYDEAGKMIGGWDHIPPDAWAKFNADMEEWKWKIRNGKFPPKTG